tara:strand:- start:3714 stop:4097 length:384 start_codon:yes stop_codon:yes gene_type:complete
MSENISSNDLNSFDNPNTESDYLIKIKIPEFTCLCPVTGQPDFATIYVRYVPDKLCVELKSLKMYIADFRNKGSFHEAVTNQICEDLKTILEPRYIKVRSKFNVRGGIYTEVEFEYKKEDWNSEISL